MLEVAIAGFLFATVSVAFLGVWGMQVRSFEKSRHHLVATAIAEDLVEQAMEAGFERTPVTLPGDDPALPPIDMITEHKGPDGEWSEVTVWYEAAKQVEEIGTPDDKLERVTVEVSWKDSAGGGTIKLVTYLAGVY